MSKDLNDFGNKNILLLTQFQEKVREIEVFVDKEINDLVNLSRQHPGRVSDSEKVMLDGFILEIEARNNVASTQLASLLIKAEELLANAQIFMEDKKSSSKQIENIKTSIMQNLHSNKDLLDEMIKRVRTKIAKLDGLIGGLKSEGQQVSKDQIVALVNEQVKRALQNYEAPLKKISKFNQVETCNSIDCLKHQLASLHTQVIEQNEGIKNISKTFASQLDKALFLVKEVQRENLKLKTALDGFSNRIEQQCSDNNYEVQSRIRRIEDSLRYSDLRKYN